MYSKAFVDGVLDLGQICFITEHEATGVALMLLSEVQALDS